MKEFTIRENDAGTRLDKFIAKAVPLLPTNLYQKYIRLKRIKINGARAHADDRLSCGDSVQLYLNDEFFEKKRTAPERAHMSAESPDILYEDKNIILIDKKPGISVHDDTCGGETLISQLLAYLYQKKEWNPDSENTFVPALCNRIDRNTGGIVIAAKNAEALRILNEKIKERELTKLYLCIICGAISPKSGTLTGYIFKDAEKKRVYVRSSPCPGAKTAVTKYRTLDSRGELTLLECELITGRTHQIRAQMAAAGHPLLGDGKYGFNRDNKKYDFRYQALYAYKLTFSFRTHAGILEYLNGKTFTAPQVEFKNRFFG